MDDFASGNAKAGKIKGGPVQRVVAATGSSAGNPLGLILNRRLNVFRTKSIHSNNPIRVLRVLMLFRVNTARN